MTAESKPADANIRTFPRMKKTRIGAFEVVPFGVPHNGTECDGFLISHSEFGRLLFITDGEMCPYNLSKVGINHLLIECNYSLDYVDVTDINREHVLLGHMELQTCKRFIKSIYSENLKSIGLIHLSKDHADPERFLAEISEIAPDSEVWIATKGKQISL